VALRGAQLAAALLLLALAALAAFDPRAALSQVLSARLSRHPDAAFGYALLDPRNESQVSSTDRSWRSLDELGRRYDRPVFWFSLEDGDYVVSDPRWVAEAEAFVAPVVRLGAGQGALVQARSTLAGAHFCMGHDTRQIDRRQHELEREQQRLDRRALQVAARASERLEKLAREAIAAGKAEAA